MAAMGAGQPEQRDGAPTSDPGAAEDDAAPRVRVLAPRADEVLRGGTRLRIEWERRTSLGSEDIEFSESDFFDTEEVKHAR